MSPPPEEPVTERLLDLFQENLKENKKAIGGMKDDLKTELSELNKNLKGLMDNLSVLNEKVTALNSLKTSFNVLVYGFIFTSVILAGIAGSKVYFSSTNGTLTIEQNKTVQGDE